MTTCSQRTAKLSQSQKIAKSIIEVVPADRRLYGLERKRKEGRCAMTFKKIWKILGCRILAA